MDAMFELFLLPARNIGFCLPEYLRLLVYSFFPGLMPLFPFAIMQPESAGLFLAMQQKAEADAEFLNNEYPTSGLSRADNIQRVSTLPKNDIAPDFLMHSITALSDLNFLQVLKKAGE
jgi:hypothetical protein